MAYALEGLSIACDALDSLQLEDRNISTTVEAACRDINKALVQARMAEDFRDLPGGEGIVFLDILDCYRLCSSRTTDFLEWDPPD